MVTRTSDIDTDTNIHNLNNLLTKLDEMRSDGVPAPERLRFIQKNSQTLLTKRDEFDWSRAYDDTALPFFERQKKLDELRKDWKVLQQSWTSSPLSSQWKDLGDELLKQLNGLLAEAQQEEGTREIEELASIWDTSPDVTEAFDDCNLTAWGAHEPYSHTRARESRKKRKERELVEELKQAVENAKVEASHPADKDEGFQELWKLWKDGSISIETLKELDPFATGTLVKATQEASIEEEVEEIKEMQPPPDEFPDKKKASDIVQQETLGAPRISSTIVDDGAAAETLTRKLERQKFVRKTYPIKTEEDESEPAPEPEITERRPPPVTEGVVRQVHDPLGQPSKRSQSEFPEVLMLNAKTWTEALSEATCEVWTYTGAGTSLYRSRVEGDECRSLVWTHGSTGRAPQAISSQWSARLDVAREENAFKVFLKINSPKVNRRWYEATLLEDELEKLHADPKPFIEKALSSV